MTNPVPIDAKALANLILDWADDIEVLVSPMKLQKLIYYCHADFLVRMNRPLVAQEFEAWEYGPVISGVFQEFKHFGAEAIKTRAYRFNPITAIREVADCPDLGEFEQSVRETFDLYCRFSASMLSRLSHVAEGPWSEALEAFNQGRNMGRKISNELVCAHHKPLRSDSVH